MRRNNMNPYLPITPEEREQMLKKIGVDSIEDLFCDVPEHIKLKEELKINDPLSEMEIRRRFSELGKKNKNIDDYTCYLGGGAYDHYIPSTVGHIAGRSEFYSSYTPYQPEVSQGTLQYIFEYQSMLAELTGMDVMNASMYDGATATAEAALMALRIKKKRNKIIVSKTVNPDTIDVLETYCHFRDIELEYLEEKDGETDPDSLEKIDKETAGVIIQNPNFYGIIEDVVHISEAAQESKSLLIMNVDPSTLGVLEAPGKLGADIVVGEGQSLGIPLSYGGPYVGFMGTTTKNMRKLPGRICGETVDEDGKRGFVLTLQAREQHIRREKANSNICSNQSLYALMNTVYLSTMGLSGMKEVGNQCVSKASYAYKKLLETDKFEKAFDKPFFKEFAVKSKVDAEKINEVLFENGIIGPLDLGKINKDMKNHLMFSITEKRTKDEIDKLVEILKGVE
jgi:glycine dehydrogenase subunit 1